MVAGTTGLVLGDCTQQQVRGVGHGAPGSSMDADAVPGAGPPPCVEISKKLQSPFSVE